jgi:hypothetical protein
MFEQLMWPNGCLKQLSLCGLIVELVVLYVVCAGESIYVAHEVSCTVTSFLCFIISMRCKKLKVGILRAYSAQHYSLCQRWSCTCLLVCNNTTLVNVTQGVANQARSEVRCSNGGQYFAAATGNVITIYDFYTFERLAGTRGHNGKVRSTQWSSKFK